MFNLAEKHFFFVFFSFLGYIMIENCFCSDTVTLTGLGVLVHYLR